MAKENIIKSLREGQTVIQLKTQSNGKKYLQHIQLNREAIKVCWKRYSLPTNGDKSQAILINEFL